MKLFYISLFLLVFSCKQPSAGSKNLSRDGYKIHTVAFEDSYPLPGDGDYNDLLVLVKSKFEKDPSGNILRIFSAYHLLAKGSGSNHFLKIRYPVDTTATMNQKILNPDATIFKTEVLDLSKEDLARGVALFPETNISMPYRNVDVGDMYSPGMIAETVTRFAKPVDPAMLGSMPHDLFVSFADNKTEIHLQQSLLPNGFPAAFAVPGIWKWQYEGNSMYDNSKSGYSEFIPWVKSNGSKHADWHENIAAASRVYPVPEADISAYLMGSTSKNVLLLSIGLLLSGLLAGFFLRRKLDLV